MIHSWKYIVFSHEYILLPLYVYNMHQDMKSAWLIEGGDVFPTIQFITHLRKDNE